MYELGHVCHLFIWCSLRYVYIVFCTPLLKASHPQNGNGIARAPSVTPNTVLFSRFFESFVCGCKSILETLMASMFEDRSLRIPK